MVEFQRRITLWNDIGEKSTPFVNIQIDLNLDESANHRFIGAYLVNWRSAFSDMDKFYVLEIIYFIEVEDNSTYSVNYVHIILRLQSDADACCLYRFFICLKCHHYILFNLFQLWRVAEMSFSISIYTNA